VLRGVAGMHRTASKFVDERAYGAHLVANIVPPPLVFVIIREKITSYQDM
jgi:hypothetical protein